MSPPGLGIVLDSFGHGVRDALQAASKLAFRQVEMPAVSREVDPENLSRSGRRDLSHHVASLGLQLSALGADLGGRRFADTAGLERRLDKIRRIMELAAELRVPMVTTHLGRLDEAALRRGAITEVVQHLAQLSDRTGTRLAFETGGADPVALAELLRKVDAPTLGVCYDPASLLIDGYDFMSGLNPLAEQVLIARARDAMPGVADRQGYETPIGEGHVDFAEYLAGLDQAGYRDACFVRRTGATHPMEEIARARDHLQRLLR